MHCHFRAAEWVVRAALVGSVALSACSRGEAAAPSRPPNQLSAEGSLSGVPQTVGAAQSAAPVADAPTADDLAGPRATIAPASIEQILKDSPLRDAKALCAVPGQ